MLSTDLTTYDTVKHLLLSHTSLQDNWITHTISRYVINKYKVFVQHTNTSKY